MAESAWRAKLAALVALATLLAVVSVTTAPPAHAAISPEAFERCLLERANQDRSAAGTGALRWAPDLVPDVREWSRSMRFNEFEHMPYSMQLEILPASWTRFGENIAMHSYAGMPDCDRMHTMWMNSPGHRGNILNPKYRFVAIGAYVDSSGWWATQFFFDARDYESGCSGSCDDEIVFYRQDGLYRYYDIKPDGNIGTPINAGTNYTTGWDSITSIDLDGDTHDEILFYRQDGLYRYYDIKPDGNIGTPINAGTNYTTGWDSITSIDLDGDTHDEILFYRQDGLYRYYDIKPDGNIGTPINAGTTYTTGWDSITSLNLD